MSDKEEIQEEFFAREENPEFIAEREYRRPTSRQEKIRHGLEGEPLAEREVYQPARRQFERTLANYVEEATKEKHELTLEAWGKAMLEASQKLSRLVRATIRGIREEYRQKPELVFNDFMLKARARVELPALWISLYLEEGQEKFDLSEPTYAARVEEIKERRLNQTTKKARVEWQNDEYRRKRAKVQKLAEKKKTNADMKAQGYPEEQRKHQLKFRMNTRDATTQTVTGKPHTTSQAKTAALKQPQKQEATQERPNLSLSKATEAQTDEDSGRSEVTVIERRREPRNERRDSQDTGFEDEQAVSTDEEAISTDEEEELQARRAFLKEEAEKKELEKARKEFKANLELQKKRMQERQAKNEQEAERWNNYQAENRKYLAAKEQRRALNEEEEAKQGKTQPRITLEKPIYKARENVESFCRLPGNHYGLTQEEASFYDKNRIATALTNKTAGRDYDQKVIDAWYGSDMRRMQNEMQEPRHRLYAYTRKAQWDLLPEGRCEPKPSNEDMQVVHYLFSFLNWEGIKRRFLELIEEGLFDSERLGQYMACTFRVGGKHLLHAYRCIWIYLYEHADFEVPAVHRDIAPQI
ncbi:unnamed protein product [Oikopleura dioica]|uniref:Uncharacterized protein n=1 Tax=Oikopleura dioica TaxID=34765 RepID=E4XMA3_OIKDI|nr:unnamed protein product [Oikopleura dioica]